MASSSLAFYSTFLIGEPSVSLQPQAVHFSLPSLASFRQGRAAAAPLFLCAASKPPAAAANPETKANRVPRGITKPRPVSPAMQELLGVTEIPRTQALKHIWAYIKEHNLQDPENKKIIVCDEKLKAIFGGRDRVGFLEISGLINPHFLK